MTPIFELCDEYITAWAALDPVQAEMHGIVGGAGNGTDYGPDGYRARAELIAATLGRLAPLEPTSEADRRAAAHLRERLEADAAWHETGEQWRQLRAQFGPLSQVRDGVHLIAHADEEGWRRVLTRLGDVPAMLEGWRASLAHGLATGLPAARRQALEAAVQADRYAGGTHAKLAAEADGTLVAELAAAAERAHEAYAETARFLREEYAPRAAQADGVGLERYKVLARKMLGTDLDPHEAYEWGWAELDRLEAELVAESDKLSPGASVAEAIDLLNGTEYVTGVDAYHAWLKEWHERAVDRLDGVHFDIPAKLRTVDVTIAHDSNSGAPYYTPPSEDLSRPGRTWWPLSGRDRFATWNELATVFHEGVPGHHLQFGAMKASGDALSRFARTVFVPANAEGWALYSERLADELGWYTEPGSRIGMLVGSAWRAARVVVDIGVHVGLPLPAGTEWAGQAWTFDRASTVLRERGHLIEARIHAELVRYLGWPAQAISYKLGERVWVAAREEARRRSGFDLKRWHTAALEVGPIGLDGLVDTLRRIDASNE
ncbi:hypothetical protein Val02_07800 [Virgisporangium aliadipatigenens]|uniref:DUF885 domain-containing protein n=1 Tax=Virgisporangium aliadipatigenens TaxID=741659 RepID=A0A8J3YEY0_9ACTN|nr:DUF885 domain-containing protein [Virgisporangium aliadipatigenens]GIJ43894.1 hypothetical protein Val02_07800 [Virgisporangium aliadipatigenens]